MELFRYPIALIACPFAAGLVLFLLWYGAKKRRDLLNKIGSADLLLRLIPKETEGLRKLKGWLLAGAVFFLALAVSGPQWGVEMTPSDSSVTHVMVAIDTSLSMLAQDIKPNRIDNAKIMLNMLVDQLSGSRIGVVGFSGKAYLQCPITTDQDAIKYFVSNSVPGMYPESGTNLGEAIDLGTRMLARYPGQKALVLLTDGEDRKDELKEALKLAKENGIAIFTVGIGKPEGDPIPLSEASGHIEYKKDKDGHPVVSRLGEKTLIEIAQQTGGAYFRYTEPESVASAIAKQVQGFEKGKWKSRGRATFKNRYQYPLFIALLLLLLELLVPERRSEALAALQRSLPAQVKKGGNK